MDVKSWLRRQPQPAYLICDGKRVAVSSSGSRKWAETAETVLSVGASTVEAYDKDGTLLRRVDLETEGETAKPEAAEASSVKGLEKLSELAQLATIIGDVGDRAARRQEAVFEKAFGALMAVVNSLSDRVVGMESAWVASLNQIAELRLALADAQAEARGKEEESMETALTKTIMEQGLSQAFGGKKSPPAKPHGKANGKRAAA